VQPHGGCRSRYRQVVSVRSRSTEWTTRWNSLTTGYSRASLVAWLSHQRASLSSGAASKKMKQSTSDAPGHASPNATLPAR